MRGCSKDKWRSLVEGQRALWKFSNTRKDRKPQEDLRLSDSTVDRTKLNKFGLVWFGSVFIEINENQSN